MAGGIEWRPGAAELLRSVRAAGLATALVTTTPRALADIVLGSIRRALGEDPFDVTICGDEVPARKPDPAPYLQAMRALGVEPDECVVIEDSQAGITAGLASGAAVLGVPAVQAVDRSRGSPFATVWSASARQSWRPSWPTGSSPRRRPERPGRQEIPPALACPGARAQRHTAAAADLRRT